MAAPATGGGEALRRRLQLKAELALVERPLR